MSRSCQNHSLFDAGNWKLYRGRPYIFLIGKPIRRTACFEWCADEVTPEIDNLQAIPVSLMPNWVKRFENKEAIVINDLEDKNILNQKNMNY